MNPEVAPEAAGSAYVPRRRATSQQLPVRGLSYHVLTWGDAGASPSSAQHPITSAASAVPLVMVHGWMDVAASFQFVVDALEGTPAAGRTIIAPDWRGFGFSQSPPVDSYWFADYLGDLDVLLATMGIQGPIDLVGHSMGGNVVMMYAGARPERIRRVVNLEGFGLPRTTAQDAPKRMAQWLQSLHTPEHFKDYASLADVAARLMKTNPRLPLNKAQWLAEHWSEKTAEGRYRLLGDPAHKRPNPVLYRVEEHLEFWKRITAPLLWVEADGSDPAQWWGTRYSKAEFHERLNGVPHAQRVMLAGCGHMLHHDQPEALAQHLAAFLGD